MRTKYLPAINFKPSEANHRFNNPATYLNFFCLPKKLNIHTVLLNADFQ